MADIARVSPNQRVDKGDVDFVSDATVRESRRVFRDFIAGEELRIIEGFDFEIRFDDTTLRITRGKEIGRAHV